jgi:hypothetical protein
MAAQRQYLDPPIEIPRRHTPWFVWLMCGFALLVVVALAYAFASIAFGGMPRFDIKSREIPANPATPTSPAPSPAAPEPN